MWEMLYVHKYVNKSFKSIIAVILLLSVLVGLCGCGATKSSKYPQLNTDFKSKENIFSFSIEPSQVLKLSNNGAKSVGDAISQIDVEYAYSDMYNCDEVKKRLNFDASVKKHTYSALDKKGDLTADSLKKCVTNNNAAFMAKKPFGYTAVEDDYIEQLCEFIVEIIDSTHKKYPDIDWQRVYCNLGNLKILYNVGMLSYAQVSDELILSISKNNTTIVLNMKGEDGFSRVLTHEIMHIIQIGCECENIHFARRFYPHKNKGEGQFMAVLHHTGEKTETISLKSKNKGTTLSVSSYTSTCTTCLSIV